MISSDARLVVSAYLKFEFCLISIIAEPSFTQESSS